MEIESQNVRSSQEASQHFFKVSHFTYVTAESQINSRVYQKSPCHDWRNTHYNQYLVKVSFPQYKREPFYNMSNIPISENFYKVLQVI